MSSRSLLIGIDSRTQTTKALVMDARSGRVLEEASLTFSHPRQKSNFLSVIGLYDSAERADSPL